MECVLRDNGIDDSSWQSSEEDRNRLLNNSYVPSPIVVNTWEPRPIPNATVVPPRSTSLEMAICISGPYVGGIPIVTNSSSATSDRRNSTGGGEAYLRCSQDLVRLKASR